ncbi:MAG: hypothetical protein FWD06_07195 [Oscillospiraceae bacterium]|nr:hypothetical protein [Oscillospiraceae bacterium]
MARLPRGTAEVTLDAKGRVAVPAKFRPIFEERYPVLWDAQDPKRRCLVLSHESYIDAIIDREMEKVPDDSRVDVHHMLIANMEDIDLDANGRFVISERYHEKFGYARGEKLFLIANKEYIELWSLPTWQAFNAQQTLVSHRIDYTPHAVKAVAHE